MMCTVIHSVENLSLIIRYFIELKLLFSLFDTDHDGRITKDEVKRLVETVSGQPWSEEQLAAFMQIVDTDSKSLSIVSKSSL